MPAVRHYTVKQVREVRVAVVPEQNESYEQAALRVANEAFENPGEFAQGMRPGMRTMPAIKSVQIERDA